MGARPSGSLPSTSATRRRRIVARRARCQLDTGLGRSAPRSLPGEWSRTRDQEDDKANPSCQQDEPYNAVVASLLPAPLRKRRARRHTRPSVGADVGARFARGGRGPAQGPAPARACQEDGSPSRSTRGSTRGWRRAVAARRVSRRERAWPSSWQAARLPAPCKRFGHAARPTGRRAGRSRRASEASPGVSTALGGYDAVAPLPKRCREERSDDRVIRLVAPGKAGRPVVLLVLGLAAVLGSEPFRRARARWRRSRSSGADARLMDECPAEWLAAVDERYAPSTDRGAARAVPARHGTRPVGAALTARRVEPNPRPGGRQGQPVLPVGRTV